MSAVIIIVGGGASGMMAAITAAQLNKNAKVILIEHGDRLGKKLLVTGNGKCNLTNRNMDISCYRSDNLEFVQEALSLFDEKDTEAFFEKLGLLLKEKNGYMYPYSEQAATVSDVLRSELARCNVDVWLSTKINRIVAKDNHFEIHCEDNKRFTGDRLILATGSKASPKTGSDGSGYELSKMLGHKVIKPLPALVQLVCEGNFWKGIAGVRCDANVVIKADDRFVCEERGELQLTEYGISGIPVFQVSRFAVRALDKGQKVNAYIDFLPALSHEKIFEFIMSQIEISKRTLNGNAGVNRIDSKIDNNTKKHGELLKTASDVLVKTAEECLNGLLNKKLTVFIFKEAKIPQGKTLAALSDKEIKLIIKTIKNFETKVTASKSFDMAQVCSGGVDTSQVDSKTMQSLKTKGLYFVGELLDVDGICGGYNLQWAWTSGYLAGRDAAKSVI